MQQVGRWKWCAFFILSLLFALLAPAATAQSETGSISGSVFDEFTWVPVTGVCVTATSQSDGATYTHDQLYSNRFYLDDLPLGLYDLTVEDCSPGLYYSTRTFSDIEVVSPLGYTIPGSASSNLSVFLTLQDGAVVTGQVVENYSGYPLEWKRVQLINANTGEPLDETCTGRDGWYQMIAPPNTPLKVLFRDGCGGAYPSHRPQWYPFADTDEGAETLTPQAGSHTIAPAALTVRGGFVGTIYDPTGQVPGHGWKVVAKEGHYLSGTYVRQDGSFAVTRIGDDILIRMEPKATWDGVDWGYLADPDNPNVAATWDVDGWDLFDLGFMLLDRPPALSGRVVDANGHPIHGAAVGFYEEHEHGVVSSVTATTDEMGWYVTNTSATGNYTAVVTVPSSDHDPGFEFNGTWLGNTPERSRATVLHLDGASRGGIDFIVKRGKASGVDVVLWTWTGPQELTTDRERNGATPAEPMEVSTSIVTQAPASVGRFLDQQVLPGFRSFGLGASIIHDPAPAAPPLLVDIALEESLLPGPIEDMQIVWNGRRLGDCTIVGAPCLQDIAVDERGDVVVSARISDGGEASFVWGPSFLDTGGSIFLNDIEWLAGEGVTKGCSPPINDLFCPDDNVTRGQMAAFLARFLRLTDRGNLNFIDDDGSVFEADIEKLAAAGITRGCNPPLNDQFCPEDPVTREQMAAFLSRALNLPTIDGVSFLDDDSSVFEQDIERLAAAGVTRGCNPPLNDRFCPNQVVTREQMAAFLHRAGTLRP